MKFLAVFALAWTLTAGQENAQTRVPKSLEACYRNRTIFERDNRLPATITTLIRLIKKIEDHPSLNMDIKDLAVTLVHRFKQDGIELSKGLTASEIVLPYSPLGYQFAKHKILLSRLIPANPATTQRFPNETLSTEEQCALHFMLSNSIDTHVRGDEAFRCSQLAQYRTNRIPRDTKKLDDVEIVKPLRKKKTEELQEKMDDYDTELEDSPIPIPRTTYDFGFETSNNQVSQCPVENGVIRTRWGTISAGTVLAGIAAGLEQQNVRVIDVIPRRVASELRRGNARQSAALIVDNRWAATLSGDISEVALLQGPRQGYLQVGAKGAWNNTAVPRWYFLSQKERHEVTDAEIRGGLDGLIIAKKIQDWRNSFGGLKLSQVLDMYYSDRGVFNGDERACKRKDLFDQVAPVAEMKAQANAFTTVLDRELTFGATLSEEAMEKFSSEASDALSNYVPQFLNDLSCDALSRGIDDNVLLEAATDLYIFVDTTWQWQEIQPVVADILENLDFHVSSVSTFTVFDAQNVNVIVENTTDLSHLFGNWTQDRHQQLPVGLNLANIVKELRTRGQNQLDQEQQTSNLGGKSSLALVITQLASVGDQERNYVVQNLDYMRDDVPDLRLLFLAAGTPSRFEPFVRDVRRDVFPLSITSGGNGESAQQNTYPVVQRIKQEPRRLINHRCGSRWDNNDLGSNSIVQFVSPKGINYYRVAPNYFFRKQDNRKIKVQGSGYGSLTVCHSRQIEHPRQNSSAQEGEKWCRNVNTDTVEIDLYHACSGHGTIRSCSPLYISVEYAVSGPTTNFRCIDKQCRNPDDARFVIHSENLGCFSSATSVAGTLSVLAAACLAVLRLF